MKTMKVRKYKHKIVAEKAKKISRRSNEYIEARIKDAEERAFADGLNRGLKENSERLSIERDKAKTELLKAAAELAVTFSKMMYNINMMVNDKLPFNQSQTINHEMRR
jgi:F0F1-type ATP synthase membrane subunit b/b'